MKILITRELRQDIEKLDLSRILRNKAFRLIHYIFDGCSDKSLYEYVPIASNYFRLVFKDGHYHKWLDKLLEAEIIIKQLNGDKGWYYAGRCLHYKLNQKYLLYENYEEYEIEALSEEPIKIGNEFWSHEKLVADFRRLFIDKEKLLKSAKEDIDRITEKGLMFNDDIKEKRFRVKNMIDGYHDFSSKEQCLEIIAKHPNHLLNSGWKKICD